MAIQAKIYSRQKNSFKNLLSFFDSAKKEIKDPNLLKLLEQLQDK
jgi:regulator of sigma D